jgi:hypothetical protein
LRTHAPGVWALGDCNGKGAFTHTAYNDFEIVAAICWTTIRAGSATASRPTRFDSGCVHFDLGCAALWVSFTFRIGYDGADHPPVVGYASGVPGGLALLLTPRL